MVREELIEKIGGLSPEEQTSVLEFIDYLADLRVHARASLLEAAEQFFEDHPDLLQRLAY